MKISDQAKNKDLDYHQGDLVEVYEETTNYVGWLLAQIKEIKGQFYLIEYTVGNEIYTKIITKCKIRPVTHNSQILPFEDVKNSDKKLIYDIDFFSTFNENKISILIQKLQPIVGAYFIFYSKENKKLIFFFDSKVDEEKTGLADLLMTTVRSHVNECKAIRETSDKSKPVEKSLKEKNVKKVTNAKIEEKPTQFNFSSSIQLEKFIYEMLKQKIEVYKKNQNVKIENKNTKDPNVIKIDIKATDEKNFKAIFDELNVIQHYISLKISEKDKFLTEDSPLSLKSFVAQFKLTSYRTFKLDEENISLQLIGPEKSVGMVSILIKQFIDSEDLIKQKESEYEKIKQKLIK